MQKNRSLTCYVTLDSAKIKNRTYYVVIVFNVVGMLDIYPIVGISINLQSRHLYWPIRIVIGKETKAMRTEFINHVCHLW